MVVTPYLKIRQINLHHSRNESALLDKMLTKWKLDIALIQEPWAYNGCINGLSRSNRSMSYDRTSITPKACTFVIS